MKTKENIKNSPIQQLRKNRDQIGKEIQDMTLEELNNYLKKNKPLHPALAKKQVTDQ